jgi:hypothetical protein
VLVGAETREAFVDHRVESAHAAAELLAGWR